jgi:hypothetical protein
MYAATTAISGFGRLTAGGVVTATKCSFHLVTASGPVTLNAGLAHNERRKKAAAGRDTHVECPFIIVLHERVVLDAAEVIH